MSSPIADPSQSSFPQEAIIQFPTLLERKNVLEQKLNISPVALVAFENLAVEHEEFVRRSPFLLKLFERIIKKSCISTLNTVGTKINMSDMLKELENIFLSDLSNLFEFIKKNPSVLKFIPEYANSGLITPEIKRNLNFLNLDLTNLPAETVDYFFSEFLTQFASFPEEIKDFILNGRLANVLNSLTQEQMNLLRAGKLEEFRVTFNPEMLEAPKESQQINSIFLTLEK